MVQRDDDVYGLFLFGAPTLTRPIDCFDVEATFELLSFDPSVESLKKIPTPEYLPPNRFWGYAPKKGIKNFITLDTLTDPNTKYVQNNKATFLVTFNSITFKDCLRK